MSEQSSQPVSATSPQPARDWTRGAAKFVAVSVLGLIAGAGIAWAMLGRQPRPTLTLPLDDASSETAPESSGAGPPPVLRPAETIIRRININTATQAELESLPGIGPALARRILDDREANGAYIKIEQLDRVKGIGPRTLQRLRPLITVE